MVIEIEDQLVGTVPASHWEEDCFLRIDARFSEGDAPPPFEDVQFVIMDDAPSASLITSCVIDGHEVSVSLDLDENGALSVQVLSNHHDIAISYG